MSKYIYCLSEKRPGSRITANIYKCDVVLPEGFDATMYQYYKELDTNDYPNIDENTFGVPDNWVFDFNTTPFDVRLLNDYEKLFVAKTRKKLEIQNSWLSARTAGSELCYCKSTITDADGNPITVSCSFDDITNIDCLIDSLANGDSDYITDISGNDIAITKSNLSKLLREMNRRITETHRTKRSLYAQIIAATNLTDLSAITWPAQKCN